MRPVVVAAVRMGYGHLRAARPLAQALGVPLARADAAPFAGPLEAALWSGTRASYEGLSRLAATRGGPFARALDTITAIEGGDAPDPATRALDRALALGLGRRLADGLGDATLLTTFYAPALAADRAGRPARLVVTDTDCARAWAPVDPAYGRLVYCAPTDGVAARLAGFGVPRARVAVTGFPLPPALVRTAEADLARRMTRLRGDEPLRVVLAVGGAGAQVDLAREVVAGLDARVWISAGTRPEVARALAGVGEVVAGDTFEAYADRFDEVLADADVLWTKPSELVFYAALGIPIVAAPPVGVQEARNLAWLRQHGAVVDARASRGELADAAERAFAGLTRDGTERVIATLT
ncbi:MAG: DUF6938 domain-containing protein [Myxococcota bacterium]